MMVFTSMHTLVAQSNVETVLLDLELESEFPKHK